MNNLVLYIATVLIWGSTWIGIKYQLGDVSPLVSIAHRFMLAAVLIFAYLLLRRQLARVSMTHHLFIALQGLCLFCTNYVFIYTATAQLTSGLVAVVFSTMVIMNMVNAAIFLGIPMSPVVALGGAVGLLDVLGHWTDTHLMIQGMSVNFLHFVFLSDWLFVTRENLIKPDMFKLMNPIGDTPVQIVSSGPDADYPNILQQYLYILYQAKEYVYIVNPYIVPDSTLSLAIKTAALSDIDVRIIVPGNSESVMIHWAVKSYFSRFLMAGVKIYLFQEGFIHSKVIISDDSVCSIGTANLDVRSLEQNFEVNALIYSKEETITMKKQFSVFQKNSKQLTLEEHTARPNMDRVKEKLARLSSPLM